MKTSELESIIGGLFIAMITAIGWEAAERAVSTLWTFVEDPRTSPYEKKFYADLASSIEMPMRFRRAASLGR